MKKNKSCFASASILVVGALTAILFIALYVFYIRPNTLEEKRALAGSPSIIVQAPSTGDTFLADNSLITQAIVTGTNPIARAELWLDGNLIKTLTPEFQGQTTFHAFSELEVSAGVHMLSWRAVDTAGLVGQSTPIQIAAELAPVAEDTLTNGTEEDQNPQGNAGQGGGNQGGGAGTGGGQPGPGQDPTPPLDDPPPETPVRVIAEINDLLIDFRSLLPNLLAAMPAAPSHLQVGFKDCRIQLRWNDNATNESHFIVWMQAIGGPPLAIKNLEANPGTGLTAFTFESPDLGIYAIWVEAVNAVGRQSSEIKGVFVNENCAPGVATHLEIEGLGLYGFSQDWKNIYCFLSIEGGLFERIPEGNETFDIDPIGGANLHEWLGGKNRVIVPMPADEDLSLEGKCVGDHPALGSNVIMGYLNEHVPRAHWDNRTLQASMDNFVVDYRVRPFGPSEAQGVYEFVNDGIPRPEIIRIEVPQSEDPSRQSYYIQHPTVRWVWKGNNSDIIGFTLYVNGTPFGSNMISGPITQWALFGGAHEMSVGLPTACGGTYQFQVAANAGNARSRLSSVEVYEQLPCRRYAQISYDSFLFAWLGGETASDCTDTRLRVQLYDPTGTTRIMPIPNVECNKKYGFITSPNRVQRFEIDPNGGLVVASVYFSENIGVSGGTKYSPICGMLKEIPIDPMPDEDWINFEKKYEERCPNIEMDRNGSGTIYFSIRGYIGAE
jgi:hypothetical protein